MTKEELIKLIKQKRSKIDSNNKALRECTSDYCFWGYAYENDDIQKEIIPLEKELYKIIEEDLKKLCPNYFNILEHSQKKLLTICAKYKETIKGLEKYKPSGYKQKIELLKDVLESESDE